MVFHHCWRYGQLWPSITVIEMASCGLLSLLKRWPFVVFCHCYRDGQLWPPITVEEMASCGLLSLLKRWPFVVFRHCWRVRACRVCGQHCWCIVIVHHKKGCASLNDCVMPFVYSCWCVWTCLCVCACVWEWVSVCVCVCACAYLLNQVCCPQ